MTDNSKIEDVQISEEAAKELLATYHTEENFAESLHASKLDMAKLAAEHVPQEPIIDAAYLEFNELTKKLNSIISTHSVLCSAEYTVAKLATYADQMRLETDVLRILMISKGICTEAEYLTVRNKVTYAAVSLYGELVDGVVAALAKHQPSKEPPL